MKMEEKRKVWSGKMMPHHDGGREREKKKTVTMMQGVQLWEANSKSLKH